MGRSFIISVTLLLIIAFAVTGAYECGDLNNDDSINILDVTFLINYLYRGGPAPAYPNLADIDGSGLINILDVTALIRFLYKSGPEPVCSTSIINPVITVDGHSACKNFLPGKADFMTPSDQDCAQYSYNEAANTLSLTHVNAGFNCCPEEILAEVTFSNDTITIIESESFGEWGPCFCLCLFDVNYTITDLPQGEYTIVIIGLELEGDDEYLAFTADLGSNPVGEYCVTRDHYPWGMTTSIEGSIVGEPACKNMTLKSDTAVEQDCIEYDYDGSGTLNLTHYNDMFNCCPESLYIVVTLENNVIRLDEYESEGLCDCICIYDMEYEITGILPGVYTLIVDNISYYNEYTGGPIEFEIDLSTPTSGIFCVDRPYLPWSE
ncbi:MAG: dockerin type I domain-containing protein [Candidatus Zixiibacteriota bacterium]